MFALSILLLLVSSVSLSLGFVPIDYQPNESGVHGRPQEVNVTFYVENILQIDVTHMEYLIHGYLIQEWQDLRLARDTTHSTIIQGLKTVWLPDLYCVNCQEQTLNDDTSRNTMIKVFQDGHIYYSQLAQLRASCDMDLIDFPFDRQVCPLNLSSYGFSDSFIRLRWNSTPVIDKTRLPQFIVSDQSRQYTNTISYPAGNFTIISFEVYFTRQVYYYVLQVFTPCAVLVILSWMIVFMEPSDIGDRMSIGVTLMLSMIFLLGAINQSLPEVSYIKAVDWYVIFSLAMIVFILLESLIVYWLIHKSNKEEMKNSSTSVLKDSTSLSKHLKMNAMNQTITNDDDDDDDQTLMNKGDDEANMSLMTKVDVISRMVFPLLYLVFNVVFIYIYVILQI